MQLVIAGTGEQQTACMSNGVAAGVQLVWVREVSRFPEYTADAFIDLLFVKEAARISLLQQLLPRPVIVNSVLHTLNEIHPGFIRINAWPGFLTGKLMEGSCLDDTLKQKGEEVFKQFNKQIKWTGDEPGFIVPRVISTVINEAYFALSEGVSTKEEIDTAMKLGTAYPYGPFEWSKKIGLHAIAMLLNKLSVEQPRYAPCPLLMKEL